ncbi:MAG TPA: DUF177 domain-containing protein [Bacillota bacterium]
MIVNISSIRDERGAALSFRGLHQIGLGGLESLGLTLDQSAKVEGKVTNTGKGFLVEAKVQFNYQASCSRCLTEFTADCCFEVKEEFVKGDHASDETVYGFSGDSIDLTECLRDQIILALPMKFLCTPECKGICPECGKNLNLEVCHCRSEQTNHQFEILKNFLSPKGGGSNGKS